MLEQYPFWFAEEQWPKRWRCLVPIFPVACRFVYLLTTLKRWKVVSPQQPLAQFCNSVDCFSCRNYNADVRFIHVSANGNLSRTGLRQAREAPVRGTLLQRKYLKQFHRIADECKYLSAQTQLIGVERASCNLSTPWKCLCVCVKMLFHWGGGGIGMGHFARVPLHLWTSPDVPFC